MSLPSRKALITTCVVILWIAAMLFALWWYQTRFIRPFSEATAVFTGDELQLPAPLAGEGKVRLVHFWDPACPCNVGNQQHLAELIQHYSAQVDFYHVQKANSKGTLPKQLEKLNHLSGLQGMQNIPASPAVAIWDKQGKLAYFGPYSEGAVCNSSNSFIEPVLNALLANRPVNAASTLAVGCFCDWQEQPSSQK